MHKNHSMSLATQAGIFLLLFFGLQWLWSWQRDSAFPIFLIEGLTVKCTTGLINLFTPQVMAIAKGTQISAAGGGINVYSGCEGVEIMFMLFAAMIISPITLRAKVFGIVIGLVYIFLLNQIRLVFLFYAARFDKTWFEIAPGTVFPILLVALTALYFGYWLSRYVQNSQSI